jgi:hypothetical protein
MPHCGKPEMALPSKKDGSQARDIQSVFCETADLYRIVTDRLGKQRVGHL